MVLIGGKIMTDQSDKSDHEIADYISTMTAQLAQMAAAQNFILLTPLGNGLARSGAAVRT